IVISDDISTVMRIRLSKYILTSLLFGLTVLAAHPSLAEIRGLLRHQARSSGTVETIQFHSALIVKTLPYNVILPPDYHVSRATRYPVLYLLHGLMGHYSDWITKT